MATSFRPVSQVPDGKKLFLTQCASCHGETKSFTGPPFQQIRRYYSVAQLTKFLHHPPKFYPTDKNMRVTRRYYHNYVHPAFPLLKESELTAILDYVDRFPYDPASPAYAHRRLTDVQKDSVLNSKEPVAEVIITVEVEED